MPHPGRQWAERSGKHKNPDRDGAGRPTTATAEYDTCSPPWT